ncbi:hypothetical protein ACFTSF_00695 [Kribbella sp. NPDC056951]|uniref:hypothetical protein n=1 Tax=Kribbella sp. NPDC056951 TaxID=3345978 RepID=UPI00362B636D
MRVLAALLTAPLLGVALSSAPVAQASQVKVVAAKVTLSRTTVAVASLNTVPVTVTVEGSGHGESVYVRFKRVSGSGPEDEFFSMPLKLVDGNGNPGLWRGTLNVPSTANGTIEPDGVYSGEYIYGAEPGEPDPVSSPPVLTVNGTHVPKLTALITPKVVPYNQPWTIRYTVTDSQTGKPYGTKLKLWVREDNRCVESLGNETSLTDASGNITLKYGASPNGDWLHCMMLPGKPAPVGGIAALVKRPAAISATPSRTSAPVGTIVPVNGTVTHGGGCPVNLQRLYGASAWRTVGTAKVRASGRFTLNAQPAYKGNIPYRAQLPACYNKVAGVSKTFTIRGV